MALTARQMISMEWSFIALTFILICLRLYLRLYLRQRRGWRATSDVFVCVGWLFFLAQASMDTVLFKLGLFYGKIDPSQELDAYGKNGLASHADNVLALKILYTESVMYYGAMYCVKFAMLVFYFELFPRVLSWLMKALYAVTGATVASWIAIICIKIFICEPVRGNWSTGNDYCPSMFSKVSNAMEWAMHVFTDLAIYLLPLFLLPHLRLPLSQKVGVGITFSLGFVCIVFANIVQVALMNPVPTPLTWLYSALEQTWALIVVCCPAFKFFLTRDLSWRKIAGRIRSSGSRSGGGGGSYDRRHRMMGGAVVSDVVEIIKTKKSQSGTEEDTSPLPGIQEKEDEALDVAHV